MPQKCCFTYPLGDVNVVVLRKERGRRGSCTQLQNVLTSNCSVFVFCHHSFSLILLHCTKGNTLKVGNRKPFPRDRAKSCEVLLLMCFLDQILALRQLKQCVRNKMDHFVQGGGLSRAGALCVAQGVVGRFSDTSVMEGNNGRLRKAR